MDAAGGAETGDRASLSGTGQTDAAWDAQLGTGARVRSRGSLARISPVALVGSDAVGHDCAMGVGADEIEAALAAFDERHVAPLAALELGAVSVDGVAAVLERIPGADEIGATWLFKAMAEAGHLPQDTLQTGLHRLDTVTAPDAVLHLLQTVQFAPPALAAHVQPLVLPFRTHPKGLVQVWALDAVCRGLGADQTEIGALLAAALTHEKAAMRARAKALAREFAPGLVTKR